MSLEGSTSPEISELSIKDAAIEILHGNEQEVQIISRDGHEETISVRPPDKNYYEGNWLWDTGLNELGAVYADPEKSRQILTNYLNHSQWKNGMLPQILFYRGKTERYFPGPDVWETEKSADIPKCFTSGITQPPVLGLCALYIYENLDKEKTENQEFLRNSYQRILDFHRFLFRERRQVTEESEGNGEADEASEIARKTSKLVSIYHPWEAGLDNSPRWEGPLQNIEISDEELDEAKSIRRDVRGLIAKYQSEGLDEKEAIELASQMRPTNHDYACYLRLVRFLAGKNYDQAGSYSEIPFNVKDILFNSVLYASNEALLLMAEELKARVTDVDRKKQLEDEIVEIKSYLAEMREGFEALYNQETGLYMDYDVRSNQVINRKTVAGFMPMFAGATTPEQAQKMAMVAEGPDFQQGDGKFLIPSTARTDPSFSPTAYWRGPIWMPVNWLVMRGFQRMGLSNQAENLRSNLLQLVREKGFSEYFDADTYEGIGRENFSWTAGLALDSEEEPNTWRKVWEIGTVGEKENYA